MAIPAGEGLAQWQPKGSTEGPRWDDNNKGGLMRNGRDAAPYGEGWNPPNQQVETVSQGVEVADNLSERSLPVVAENGVALYTETDEFRSPSALTRLATKGGVAVSKVTTGGARMVKNGALKVGNSVAEVERRRRRELEAVQTKGRLIHWRDEDIVAQTNERLQYWTEVERPAREEHAREYFNGKDAEALSVTEQLLAEHLRAEDTIAGILASTRHVGPALIEQADVIKTEQALRLAGINPQGVEALSLEKAVELFEGENDSSDALQPTDNKPLVANLVVSSAKASHPASESVSRSLDEKEHEAFRKSIEGHVDRLKIDANRKTAELMYRLDTSDQAVHLKATIEDIKARKGLNDGELSPAVIDGKTHWFLRDARWLSVVQEEDETVVYIEKDPNTRGLEKLWNDPATQVHDLIPGYSVEGYLAGRGYSDCGAAISFTYAHDEVVPPKPGEEEAETKLRVVMSTEIAAIALTSTGLNTAQTVSNSIYREQVGVNPVVSPLIAGEAGVVQKGMAWLQAGKHISEHLGAALAASEQLPLAPTSLSDKRRIVIGKVTNQLDNQAGHQPAISAVRNGDSEHTVAAYGI